MDIAYVYVLFHLSCMKHERCVEMSSDESVRGVSAKLVDFCSQNNICERNFVRFSLNVVERTVNLAVQFIFRFMTD